MWIAADGELLSHGARTNTTALESRWQRGTTNAAGPRFDDLRYRLITPLQVTRPARGSIPEGDPAHEVQPVPHGA